MSAPRPVQAVDPMSPARPDVRTEVCPHGPLLVRGAHEWPTPDGGTAPVTRPVVAVCRCERSQRMPWCDGTHKVVPKGWDDVAEQADRDARSCDGPCSVTAGASQPRAVR